MIQVIVEAVLHIFACFIENLDFEVLRRDVNAHTLLLRVELLREHLHLNRARVLVVLQPAGHTFAEVAYASTLVARACTDNI